MDDEKKGLSQDFTQIPNNFIDEYMLKATHTQMLVYLLILRHNGVLTDISDTLGITIAAAQSALDYWESLGIIKVSSEGDEKRVEFLDKSLQKKRKSVEIEKRPVYTTSEIERYTRDTEIQRLFKSAEAILGKTLSYNDLNSLLSFYEWNRLPVDVIETMLSHCAERGHFSMRYIEKVALTWDDEGIRSVEEAKAYIQLFNNDFKKIMAAFGISQRSPAKTEREFMLRWLKEWEFPLEVILEACDRAVMSTGRISFKYADKILKVWKGMGIMDLESVKEADENYKNHGKRLGSKKNHFINYTQREWDFDAIEKMEMQKLKKELGVD